MRTLAALIFALCLPVAHGEPHVPADDSLVLETLPERRDAALAALKRLRAASVRMPNDVQLASGFAKRAIEASRATGDPRYLGQAQSALQPWWTAGDVPLTALLLRATVKQSLHDFGGALADLDRLLAVSPSDAQARLTRATVLTVVGRYAEALRDCDAIEGPAVALVVSACRAEVTSRTGRAQEALAMLDGALGRERGDSATRAWAVTLAAEIAAIRGESPVAERYFKMALALDPGEPYLIGAYADWLLDAGRAGEAAALVADRTRNDALLLRRVIALAALDDHEALANARRELAARMEASRRRGDDVHLREEARYALDVERDAARAVELARRNWRVQREPADLRILAASARAAGDADAVKLVTDWIAVTKLEDVRVRSALNGGGS